MIYIYAGKFSTSCLSIKCVPHIYTLRFCAGNFPTLLGPKWGSFNLLFFSGLVWYVLCIATLYIYFLNASSMYERRKMTCLQLLHDKYVRDFLHNWIWCLHYAGNYLHFFLDYAVHVCKKHSLRTCLSLLHDLCGKFLAYKWNWFCIM